MMQLLLIRRTLWVCIIYANWICVNNCHFIYSLLVYFITAKKNFSHSLQIYASSLFAFINILLSMIRCLISQIMYISA